MSEAEAEGDAPAPAKSGKKKLLVLVAAAVLLVGGGAGAWSSGVLPRLLGRGGESHAEAGAHGGKHGDGHGAPGAPGAAEARVDTAPVFMDLPEIVANLNGGPRRTVFVKLHAKLELARAEDQATLTAVMPRVLDLFGGYLREMRPEELRGAAGTYRLREELLARTNLAAPPVRVVSVLFTEMLVQ